MNGFNELDLDAIVGKTPDAQGAVIAEIAKRAVRLYQRQGTISTANVIACIVTMDYQVEIMNEKPEQLNDAQKFRNCFLDLINEALTNKGF